MMLRNNEILPYKEEMVELRYIVIESPELAVTEEVVVESVKIPEDVKEEPAKEQQIQTEKEIESKEAVSQPDTSEVKEAVTQDELVAVDEYSLKEKEQAYLIYYNLVREKIRAHIDSRTRKRYRGTVRSVFTIGPDGSIYGIDQVVPTEGTSANKRMMDDAVRGIKRAGPFPPFPGEIGADPITFSLDIRFIGPE